MTELERTAHALKLELRTRRSLGRFAKGKKLRNTMLGELFSRDLIKPTPTGHYTLTELGHTVLTIPT